MVSRTLQDVFAQNRLICENPSYDAQMGQNHKKKARQSRNTVTLNRGNISVLPGAIGPEAGALVRHVCIPGRCTTRAKGRTDQLTLAARYSYRLSRRGTGIRYAERQLSQEKTNP